MIINFKCADDGVETEVTVIEIVNASSVVSPFINFLKAIGMHEESIFNILRDQVNDYDDMQKNKSNDSR